MSDSQSLRDELFSGLKLLAEDAFPRQCASCGASYADLAEFISGTTPVGDGSGLAARKGDEDASLLALARQCGCGSEMLEYLDDRRSQHDVATRRRDLFDRLLELLTEGGMEPGIAKCELLKVMRGQQSPQLSREQIQQLFSEV